VNVPVGSPPDDPRLDRLPEFDERSRLFAIAEVVPVELRSKGWPCYAHLDQGREGACVGFGWSHELAASPATVRRLTDSYARDVYKEAQRIDQWPGEDYSGTSVLAGAKVCLARGFMDEYRWAFSIDDVLRALSWEGPVVIGIDWMDSMFRPRPSGLLDVRSGSVAGGHCLTILGHSMKGRLRGEKPRPIHVVRLRNSWGSDWGRNSDCYMRVEDLEWLLDRDGEACVPVGRKVPRVSA
jgi:Papain family cysteine protease